jgi:hypothetical protein
MDPTTFTITLKRDVVAGYSLTNMCVRCSSSSGGTKDRSPWNVAQYKDCTTALTVKSSGLPATP